MAEDVKDKSGETPANASDSQKSKKELFRERIGKRYPDLNLDDEESYYDRIGKDYDQFEGYEDSSRKLAERMKSSPAFRDMVIAAGKQDDFDPIIYLTEQRGLDLKSLVDDPDYSEKLAKAHSDYLSRESENKKIDDAMAENMPKSIEAIRAKSKELGLSDDAAQEIVGKMYKSMDDMIHGILDPEYFALLAKGENFDSAVSDARDEGMAAGLNKKVDEKLRVLENKSERVSGRQTPIRTEAPRKKRTRNMFLAGDEDEEYI